MTLCEHYECRCARAHELALIADRTGDVRYLTQAIEVHSQKVCCRRSDYGQKDARVSGVE